jgi:cbb3-type cytochrome oxidase subunit 3
MDEGANKALFVLIAVVIFGIFLAIAYWMFQDEFKAILEDVMAKVSTKAGSFSY